MAKSGRLTTMRRQILFCLKLAISAEMSRALRKAVSPVVMGAATTPRITKTAPNDPSHELQMALTIIAGLGPELPPLVITAQRRP